MQPVDQRRFPRFKIEVPIMIISRSAGVLQGHTLDLSESGVAAMLKMEVPLGELVELEFELPYGKVHTHATARQRSAFRYGFQFVWDQASEAVKTTCRQLEREQALFGA